MVAADAARIGRRPGLLSSLYNLCFNVLGFKFSFLLGWNRHRPLTSLAEERPASDLAE
jgi:hypothetical protein